MYKEVLRSIEGVEIYPIISLTIFFIFFSFMLIKVFKMKKKDIEYLSAIPTTENELND